MDNTNKAVGFKLVKITTEQFATIEECYSPKEGVNLQALLRFAADTQKRMIGVFAEFRFTCREQVFLMIEAGCHFEIEPQSWEGMVHDDTLIIPRWFLTHLAVITTGTVRGILHAKTEGTPFAKFLLPTVNITELVKDDVHISLKEQ